MFGLGPGPLSAAGRPAPGIGSKRKAQIHFDSEACIGCCLPGKTALDIVGFAISLFGSTFRRKEKEKRGNAGRPDPPSLALPATLLRKVSARLPGRPLFEDHLPVWQSSRPAIPGRSCVASRAALLLPSPRAGHFMKWQAGAFLIGLAAHAFLAGFPWPTVTRKKTSRKVRRAALR
jgi:hypothetical protein